MASFRKLQSQADSSSRGSCISLCHDKACTALIQTCLSYGFNTCVICCDLIDPYPILNTSPFHKSVRKKRACTMLGYRVTRSLLHVRFSFSMKRAHRGEGRSLSRIEVRDARPRPSPACPVVVSGCHPLPSRRDFGFCNEKRKKEKTPFTTCRHALQHEDGKDLR